MNNLDDYLADAVSHGAAPFAIAAADGGDHEYWHPRRGTDPAGMIVHEFLPLLARQGLAVDRIGLLGASMGGYGALYLAERLGPRRVAVMVAESPAIWHGPARRSRAPSTTLPTSRGTRSSEPAPGPPARDRAAHRLRRRRRVRPDHPRRALAAAPAPAGGVEPGGHDGDFWRSQAPAQLGFVARHLGRRVSR